MNRADTRKWLETSTELTRTQDIATVYLRDHVRFLSGPEPRNDTGTACARSEARRVRRILARRLQTMHRRGGVGWTASALVKATGLSRKSVGYLLHLEEEWIDLSHPENLIVTYDEGA